MPPTTILSVNGLTKRFGTDEIFRDLSFQINDRERVAVVGINGAGKSTILSLIEEVEHPDAGEIVRASGLRVTYLPQEARFDGDRTVREEAHLAFEEAIRSAGHMREIEIELSVATGDRLDELLVEYDRLQHHFEVSGGYEMEHRTEAVLGGLGFTEDQWDQPARLLSGGQKTRLALAKALLTDPDLLLLDEPTNHLDLEMMEWLEEFLKGWNGACLIVSHDRYFLDRVTTRTLELSFGSIEDYPAPYSRYLALREERMTRRLKEYEEQQEFIARTEEYIRKYKAGQRAREAKGRQTRLERMERIVRPRAHDELRISLSPALRSGRSVLSTTPMIAGFKGIEGEDIKLLTTPELQIERGDRIGLIGPNGSGKTTLLRTLIGQIEARSGRAEFGTNTVVGYYGQSHEQLPPTGTPLSTVLAAQPMGEEAARAYLGRFLFSGDDVYKPVNGLSGGERSRLALSLLMLQRANVLVLDEPTNHLDILAREALEEMLDSFDGTILFVSHDRYFIDRIATSLWSIGDGALSVSLGNYSDLQRTRARALAGGLPAPLPREAAKALVEAPRRSLPARPFNEARVQKELLKMEKEIARLEGKLNRISDDLTVASIGGELSGIEKLGFDHSETSVALDQAYASWETLSAELESGLTAALLPGVSS